MTIAMVTTWHNSWHGTSIGESARPNAMGQEEEGMLMMMATSDDGKSGWDKSTAAKGVAYLLLSELFLHGFLMHPYFVSLNFGQTKPFKHRSVPTENLHGGTAGLLRPSLKGS